jgi:hypothetical protein
MLRTTHVILFLMLFSFFSLSWAGINFSNEDSLAIIQTRTGNSNGIKNSTHQFSIKRHGPFKDSVNGPAKFECAWFFGIGGGGENSEGGFSYGSTVRFNFNWHTLFAGVTKSASRDRDSHYGVYHPLSLTTFEFAYGPGLYREKYSLAAGLGFCHTIKETNYLTFHPGSAPGGSPSGNVVTYKYNALCSAWQFTCGGSAVRFAMTAYLNPQLSGPYCNGSVLLGLTIKIPPSLM